MKKLLLTLIFSLLPLNAVNAQVSTENQPNLISPETNINYKPLQTLLKNQQWREANEKTSELMLKAAKRDQQGWIPTEDVLKFACWDLKTVDQLWQDYSNGRFGFSPQLAIFLKTGNRPGRLMAIDAYEKFGDTVGWRAPSPTAANNQQDWIIFKENLSYTLDAPVGHLPQLRQAYNLTGNRLQFTTLTKRLIECNIGTSPKP